jgi:serine/threonine protein kinase
MAKRFRHEIKLARRVSHRNVCRIHEYGEDGGLRYISMEYLEGTDLKHLLRDTGGLPADQAFEVAIQLAEGLQAIHDVGIIHRDLKTPNIMRDAKGVIRLMDFGIAKEGSEEGTGGSLTATGQIMGTPEYMSPEQGRGERIDFRSDIYALGVVDYEMFTGQVPFRGDTPVATIFKHIQDPVPLEGGPASRIPGSAVPLLRKALAKDRSARFASAGEMAEALRQARAAAAGAPPPLPAAGAPTPALGAVTTPLRDSDPAVPFRDRRQTGRLDIFVNLIVRRVGTLGTVLQEERTIAENIGRGGARVLTGMVSVATGDVLHLEEVGGDFRTRAEVRNAYVGKDNIRRLNLRFLDGPAPDRLVRTDGAN